MCVFFVYNRILSSEENPSISLNLVVFTYLFTSMLISLEIQFYEISMGKTMSCKCDIPIRHQVGFGVRKLYFPSVNEFWQTITWTENCSTTNIILIKVCPIYWYFVGNISLEIFRWIAWNCLLISIELKLYILFAFYMGKK